MDQDQTSQMEFIESPVQPDGIQRTSRPLHRVPSKQLGSGSGAGLWLSGTDASTQESDGSETNGDEHQAQAHESASLQAAVTPVKRASKLYHFPATLARGLRFLNPESVEDPSPHNAEPVAKLQEHNLLRMSSKEELEQTVDLDLSFDFVSTAERPVHTAAGSQSHAGELNLQEPFQPVGAPSDRKISTDSVEKNAAATAVSTPTSIGRASPGRGMAATNWAARAAKQPPIPLDLSATNPAKLSDASSVQGRPRASSRATKPSLDIGRSDSLRAAHSPRAESESQPQVSDSISFISHQSKDSRSSRNSRAPPTLPPTGPLPPVPDGTASKRSSQSSRMAIKLRNLDHEDMSVEDDARDEDREELRDTDESDGREHPTKKRDSDGSTYSGESGDSFQTAGIASIGNSSAENISSSGSQFAAAMPLPTVPSVIWKQRQQRIERQVAAAATARASAVPATFAIKYPKPPGVDIVPLGQQLPEESPRVSFGFQSPNPGQLQRWSSIPSQLAALVAAADGPIKPAHPPTTQGESIISAGRDLVSPHANAHLSVVDTPTTDTSSPFSPLFSDPGTAFSAATTMSRNSTQSSADPKADFSSADAIDNEKVGEETADQTVVPAQVHTRHTSTTTVAMLTSDSEVEGDEARARRRRLPMHISTVSESDHGSRHASMMDLRASAARSGPWPHSPLLLTPDQSRASRDLLSTRPSLTSSAETTRVQRATELNSMGGVGLGLDLGLGSELEEPRSGHASLAVPADEFMASGKTESTLHRVKSDSGLASQRRRSDSPHVEIDMSLISETKPGAALAIKDFGRIDAAALAHRRSAVNTPSTLPMLSPRPLSSPYLGRIGMEISTNSSVEAFACNVTPPMPSAAFPERVHDNVQRAGERKSEGHLLTSAWLNQAQHVGTRLSYRIAHASWLPTHVFKQEHPTMEASARPVKEKQSPLPSPASRFEDGAVEGPIARRSSAASANMRRRRSTATVNWGPNVGSTRNVPPTVASSQTKGRRQPVMFGNAAFNAPARTPATTNMLPGGTLLSKSLFYAGFCGMPWLWLVGGWWLGPDGMLACTSSRTIIYQDQSDSDSDEDSDADEEHHEDWDMVGIDETTSKPVHEDHVHDHTDGANFPSPHLHPDSAALHRDGSAEGQSTLTSRTRSGTASSNEREGSPTHDVPLSRMMVPKAKKSESFMQFYDVAVHQDWEGLEQYVRYNRIAALIGSCVVFTAFVLAIWGIARNW
ncbi:hypothetical protein OC861_003369 [Tilletia horrida]|nr:hypothetical protein OC861_003369 [Tilletia horrida]